MKLLSILALGLLTVAANASVPSDLTQYDVPSLEIQSANDADIKGIANTGVKTVHGTVYTSITNVCIEGETLTTISDVIACSKWGYKALTRSQCDKDNKRFPCFDNNERVCVEYAKVSGSHPMNYEISACAAYTDAESREWRMTAGNEQERFKTNFPECSVFKSIPVKKTSTFNFNIVNPNGKVGYDQSLDGVLVDKVQYELPTCSEL